MCACDVSHYDFMTISEGGHKHAREFGGWGVVFVSIATAGNLIVVSCAPGWTEEDWDAAIAAAQISTNAYFDAEEIEADGTEILYFTTARAEVSVA